MGYSAMDIITTLFRVVKTFPNKDTPEYLKLEFIRVIPWTTIYFHGSPAHCQEIQGARRVVCQCM